MAFKWGSCVGIQEKWEAQRMYDPHFLAKGLKPVRLTPRVLLLYYHRNGAFPHLICVCVSQSQICDL
jgi:hypothetical protein